MPKTMNTILKEWLAALGSDLPELFVVGGAVRDFLMRRSPKDVDLVCQGAQAFAGKLAAGQAVPAVVVPFEKKPHAPCFRVVRKNDPGHFIDVVQMSGATIEEDLHRRDFTINALAGAVLSGGDINNWIDPLDGRADLDRRLIRACDPAVFTNDPLRILRAARLSAELGFTIEPETLQQMSKAADSLSQTASERITAELFLLLQNPHSAPLVTMLDETGALGVIFPEIIAMKGCTQNGYHHLDVWGHTLEVIAYCESVLADLEHYFGRACRDVRDLLAGSNIVPTLKLSALLHDMGKPPTKRFSKEKGRTIFHGHAGHGADMAETVARRLKLSAADRKLLCGLIRNHMRPVELFLPGVKEKTVIKWFRQAGDDALLVLLLAVADVHGKSGARLPQSVKDRFYEWTKAAAETYVGTWQPTFSSQDLISGKDLMAMGVAPGPTMGDILRQIREAQDNGTINDKTQALELARHITGKITGQDGAL